MLIRIMGDVIVFFEEWSCGVSACEAESCDLSFFITIL
jgi:hypothetical protein